MKSNSIISRFFTIVFILIAIQLPAQEKTEYVLKENIPYRTYDEEQKDEYIAERCKLDIYYPANTKDFTTVVWFHGGSLTAGNKSIPVELKEKGVAVVSANYRLAPKVKSPVFIEDAAATVAWVFNHIEEFGGDTSKIVVAGHSAGGYLAAMIGFDKKWLAKYDIDANRIAMLVPLSGQMITHFAVRRERGISDIQPVIDSLAPLYHVRVDAPPTVLVTGDREHEMIGRYEENAYMMRMMKVVGHTKTKLYELDGFNHVGMVSPGCKILLNEIKKPL